MREQLIRYLLGELDANERRDLQSRLKSSPELRAELEQLRSCFAANQDEDLFAPDAPTGLAARTAGRVVSGEGAGDSLGAGQGAQLSHAGDPPTGFLGWSLADLTVAGGVMLAVSMLIFPAIRNSRDGTRRNLCQNNQQVLFSLISHYANDHGRFPEVGPNENAGMYTARLILCGYVEPEELEVLLRCPGAPLADKFRRGELKLDLPKAEEIRSMPAAQLMSITARSSPFYNYRFPYRVGQTYYNLRNDHRSLSPVLADASGDDAHGSMSPNHGGGLVLVQCGNGNLQMLTSVTLPGLNDDMYHNDLGKVAAGMGSLDTVLGPSDATPSGEGSVPNK
jgi:hypothetical protein